MIHPYLFMAILVYTNVLDTESFQFQNLTWRKSTLDRLDRGFSDTFRLNMGIPRIARSLSGGNPFHEFASLRYHKLDQDEQTPEQLSTSIPTYLATLKNKDKYQLCPYILLMSPPYFFRSFHTCGLMFFQKFVTKFQFLLQKKQKLHFCGLPIIVKFHPRNQASAPALHPIQLPYTAFHGFFGCKRNHGIIYPLVNSHNYMERSTMLLMGKSTKNSPFQQLCQFTRGHIILHPTLALPLINKITRQHQAVNLNFLVGATIVRNATMRRVRAGSKLLVIHPLSPCY